MVCAEDRISLADVEEVGRFASYLKGERAYSFTPHSKLDRFKRRLRWTALGALLLLKVEFGLFFRAGG